MDHEAFKKAERYADERWPLPNDTPASAAAKTAMMSFLLLLFFDKLDHWLGFPVAFFVAVATASAMTYFDTNLRYGNHSKAMKEAIERYEREQ